MLLSLILFFHVNFWEFVFFNPSLVWHWGIPSPSLFVLHPAEDFSYLSGWVLLADHSAAHCEVISSFPFPLLGCGVSCLLTQFSIVREAPYCFSSAAEVLFRQNKTRARSRGWWPAEGQGTEAWSWLGIEEDEAQEAQEGKYCYGSHLPLCPLAGGQEWNSCIWCTCPTQKPVTQTPSILSEEQMMVKVQVWWSPLVKHFSVLNSAWVSVLASADCVLGWPTGTLLVFTKGCVFPYSLCCWLLAV